MHLLQRIVDIIRRTWWALSRCKHWLPLRECWSKDEAEEIERDSHCWRRRYWRSCAQTRMNTAVGTLPSTLSQFLSWHLHCRMSEKEAEGAARVDGGVVVGGWVAADGADSLAHPTHPNSRRCRCNAMRPKCTRRYGTWKCRMGTNVSSRSSLHPMYKKILWLPMRKCSIDRNIWFLSIF